MLSEIPAGTGIIAIVEDDASFNRALERLLRASGFDTETFFSAEDFLARARPESPACLILDIRLPGMSGFQLFDRLSESGSPPLVVFITAQTEEAVHQQAYRLSGHVCLRKPLVGAVLLEALHSQLRRNGSGPE